jgi:hypothetical protein
MSTIGLNSLLDENKAGRLSKVYTVYSGSVVKYEYATYSSAIAGAQCLKTTYIYSGSLLTGVYRGIDTWTQEMEDATKGAVTTFDNSLSTSFDGINDYIDFGNTHLYDASTAFSISMWVKPQNVAAQRTLFAKATNDANVYGYILYHNSSGDLFLQMRSAGNLRSHTFTGSTLTASTWQMVTLTYAGASNINGARVYVNTTVGTTPSTGPLGTWLSGQDFTLGSRNTTFNFSGNIDEITIWDKALSSTEVAELYDAGTPINPTTHSAASNLQSWYRMGDNDVYPTITDNQGTDDGTMTNMNSGDFVLDVPE